MRVVAIDLGGTSIKSGIIRAKIGEPTNKYKVENFDTTPTNSHLGRDILLNTIADCIIKLLPLSNVDFVAMSSAGTVDWDSGSIIYATNALPNFTGLELSKVLSNKVGKRVVVVNDAVCALIGEAFYQNKPQSNALMLTLGTGLGSAIIDTSSALNNNSIQNLQIAHIKLHKDGHTCACGQQGCAEQYVSATALKRQLNDINSLTISDKSLTKDFFQDFGTVVEYIQKAYNPNQIIVGGGIIELKEFWWNNFINYLQDNQIDSNLIPAVLGNQAGLLGSVYAVLNGKFGSQ